MPWSERQAALLRGLGLRLWAPLPAEPSTPPSTAPAPAPAMRDAAASLPTPLPTPPPTRPPTLSPPPAAAARPAASAGQPPPESDAAVAPAMPRPRPGVAEPGAHDWAALRQAVVDCRACGLCQSRRQTVFGVGHPQAHWLVVGEAPGEQEDLKGEPFVGAAGQLLDRMLAALGLTRSEEGPLPPQRRVYIANALKCRPPGNRNPSAEEVAQCEPFLLRQIELLRPRLILAMGRFAVQALLRSDEPIGKLRGRVHRYQGLPLVVTYHPAYLLRSPLEKARAWEDLCLAAGVAEAGSAE